MLNKVSNETVDKPVSIPLDKTRALLDKET